MRTVVLCALVLWGGAWGSPQCGGVLRHHKGSLSTPHFPGPFPVPIRCRWLIENTLPGTLLVARLTQVFVTAGLELTEFVHYEPGSPQFQLGGRLLVAVSADDDPASSNATGGVVTTERPYLVVDFRLAALEGNHVRALAGLLDVYGFNMTYEAVREPASLVPGCSVADCSYSGHCYASADYSRYECSCFEGFSGPDCSQGSLCRPGKHFCKADEKCRQLGSEVAYCTPRCSSISDCPGENGTQTPPDCRSEGCVTQCPYQPGKDKVCQCALRSALTTDRARYQGTVRLANLTALRDILRHITSTFQATLEKHISKYLRSGIANITELRVLNISWMGEVTFHFSAARKEGGKVRELLNRLVERGRLGNLTLVSTHISLKQEPTLSLQSVKINQGKPLVREGEEFNVTCTAQGSAFMTFRWYKDGAAVNVRRAQRVMWEEVAQADSQDQYVSVLGAPAASRLDEGRYTCQVVEWGVQQCQSVTLDVVTAPQLTVVPRSLTVRKGQNASIVCVSREDGRRERFGYNWTKNKLLLPVSPGQEVWEDLQPAGSILRLFNLQRTARYECLAHGQQGVSTAAVQVDVLEDGAVPTCKGGTANGIRWPEMSPHGVALLDCLPPLRGVAGRRCSLRDGERAVWEPPDFSTCIHPRLAAILDQFESLTLGYENTTVSESLSQCLQYLQEKSSVPGEGKAVVKLLNSVREFLHFTKDKEGFFASKDTFLQIVNMLLATRRSLTDQQSVVELQSMLLGAGRLWGSLLLNASFGHASLSCVTLDVLAVSAAEAIDLHFPLLNVSYPSWLHDRFDLHIEGYVAEPTKSVIFTVIVYKNLTEFLRRRDAGRRADGEEFQYEVVSRVVSVALEGEWRPTWGGFSASLELELWSEWAGEGLNCSDCEVRCAVGSGPRSWDVDACLTTLQPSGERTLCRCRRPGSYTLLLASTARKAAEVPAENQHLVVVLGCLLCLLQTLITLLLLLPCWWRHRNCLLYLKLQCCTATSGAMAVFIYAISDSVPQSSFPYVTTSLEALLLIGISSHLSKVLIIYTEVVQLPKVRYLKKTVISIITGLPVLAALCSRLAHDSLGLQLRSWWLLYGSALFNVFATALASMLALFLFLYCSLMRRLHVVCHGKHLDAAALTTRVGFLRRGATIFSFMLVVDVSSVCYVNLHSRSYHYIFSLSSALLGSIIFVCYIWKSETPLCFWMLFKLKVGESMKDAKPNSSPPSISKQAGDLRPLKGPPWIQNEDSANSDMTSADFEMETRRKVRVTRAPLPDVAPCTGAGKSSSHEALPSIPEVSIQPYPASPRKYDQQAFSDYVRQEADLPVLSQPPPPPPAQEIVMAKVCVELGLVSSRQWPAENPAAVPAIVLCSVDVDTKPLREGGLSSSVIKALLQEDAPEDPALPGDLGEDPSSQAEESPKSPDPAEDEGHPEVKKEDPEPETDQNPDDSIDCMLDRISHDLDYLLERNVQKDDEKSVCLSIFD